MYFICATLILCIELLFGISIIDLKIFKNAIISVSAAVLAYGT